MVGGADQQDMFVATIRSYYNLLYLNVGQSSPPRCRGEVRGIATPALLCHKEPARRIQSLIGDLERKIPLEPARSKQNTPPGVFFVPKPPSP